MQKTLTPAERLIVAADFRPGTVYPLPATEKNCRALMRRKVLSFADSLQGTGVCIKMNSVLRALGYDLIGEVQSRGLRVFADLKLFDIGETLATDGMFLKEEKPYLLTTVCTAGISAMQALKAELPDTEVLGVTVLTSLKDADTQTMFTCSTEEAVMRFSKVAAGAGIDGLISSPKEAEMLRARFGVVMSINTPGIRFSWMPPVAGDDQNPDRIMTPAKAIKAGVDRIIIGRPIVRAENPRDAVLRTLEEIESAMA